MDNETRSTSTSPRRFRARTLAAALAGGLALGGGAVYLVTRAGQRHEAPAVEGAAAPRKPLYQCPMHPSITSDRESDCPICGMKLVLVNAADAGVGKAAAAGPTVEGLATVQIDPARQQIIGLRIAPATLGPIGGAWRTTGRVAVDETRVHHVNVKVEGFVEHVHVDFVGKPVRRGEPLFSLYSPELLSLQSEYLLALKTRKALGDGTLSGSGDELVRAARERLRLWDVPDSVLEELERTGKPQKTLTMVSPISGVVTKKDVVHGHKLTAGDMPYEITDLSQVWVLADVYESDIGRTRVGMPATLALQAFPNRIFSGRVVFIDPVLDSKTRTVKVRIAFPNPNGELRPEMYGEVSLRARAHEGLRIPADAVIDSGNRKVVFVSLGDGKFAPREVKLDAGDGDQVEVLSGLEPGEEVVVRANFLVDSESRLKASLAAIGGK